MSLEIQFYTMGMMLCGGLMLGVVFDAYKIAGDEFRFPRWTIAVLDLAYWLAACVVIFRILYAVNAGEVRMYVFVGLFIGVWLYAWWFSTFTRRMVMTAIRILRVSARFVMRATDWLIVKPFHSVYKALLVLLGFLGALTIFLFKVMVQLIYPIRKVAVWLSKRLQIHDLWQRIVRWLKTRFSRNKR